MDNSSTRTERESLDSMDILDMLGSTAGFTEGKRTALLLQLLALVVTEVL